MRFSPRQAITLTFAAFGAAVGAQIGAIPVLKTQTGVDAFVFGLIAALGTMTTIGTMSLGGVINRRFDHRSVLLTMLPLTFASMVYSLTAHSVWSFAFSFVLFNVTIGATDLFMNAEAAVVEHDLARPVFSSFHAAVLYTIGLFGLIGGYIAVNYGAIWAALPVLPWIILAFVAVYQAIPHRPGDKGDEAKTKTALPYKVLTLIGLIAGLDVAAELTCIQWSGQLLNDMRPELAAYSGLGVAFYGMCSGTVRLFGDKLRARVGDIKIVIVSLCIGIAGFLILATNPSFTVSILAFALVGTGLALNFPCLFALAAHAAPEARAAALSVTSAVSGPPRVAIPIVLGILAQSYGMSMIYVAAATAITMALALTFWAGLELRKSKRAQIAPRPHTIH